MIRIAAHVEIAWLEGNQPARCPNCGADAPMRRLLEIDYRPPDAVHRFIMLVCAVCTGHFTDNPEMMDYATDELIEIGWHTYQIQLGAGVWPIAAPLTRIAKPAGAKMLEIGGAYGFGLDFGSRGQGWAGVGFDPSPLAAFGARELGLDVRQNYFGEAELAAGPFDVVLATEVVEHLAAPGEFLALLRRAVAADGILLLTTPDAAWITPDLPAGQLMPLLSPGAHVVLQTARSLELALRAAGFAQVQVRREAMSLVAYASPAAFALSDDTGAGRERYRRYLVERAARAAQTSDLRLGFAGRGLFEAANDGDAAAATAAWEVLCPAVQVRFGLDLATMTQLPAGVEGASLADLARLMPLGLGMILFGRAMQRLAQGEDRAALLPLFRLTLAATDALQAAMARRSLGDGLSAALRTVTEVEVLLCLADAGDEAAVPGLRAMTANPAKLATGWRGLVGLVNAGAFAAARTLAAALRLDDLAGLPADLRRNALLSLANLALAPGGEAAAAFQHARALEAMGEPADGIVLQAFTRLVNAGAYSEALAAVPAQMIEARTERLAGGTASDDAKLARMVLDLAVGDPAELPARLAGLALPPARRAALLLEAFVRLVNAARYEAAAAFGEAHDVPELAAGAAGKLGEDAKLGLTILELAAGDPAAVPARLAGAVLPAARREALLLDAYVRLVNASRFDAAADFAAAHEVSTLAARAENEAGSNAVLALAVAELAAGDPALVPARLALRPVAPERAQALLFGAFTGLVNTGRYDEARALAEAHGVLAALETAAGAAAADAGIAAVLLAFAQARTEEGVAQILAQADKTESRVLDELYVDGFVRLVNEARFEPARRLNEGNRVEATLANCAPDLRLDALAALALLDLAPGGEMGRVGERLAAAARGGVAEERVTAIGFAALVGLVNNQEMRHARKLLPLIDAALVKLRPPYDPAARDALFAAGVLALDDPDGARRAAAMFSRLRDALVKLAPADAPADAPDPLFWPALRGEVVALHRLDRAEEAGTLLASFLAVYAGAPDDLREHAA